MKLLSTVVLQFGYAESAIVGPLLVSTRFYGFSGFEDHKLGLMTLAEDLYACYRQQLFYDSDPIRQCCHEASPTKDSPFCAKCGQRLFALPSEEEFQEFLCSLPGQTVDGFPLNEDIQIGKKEFHKPKWYPFWTHNSFQDIRDGNFIIIQQQAEMIMSQLLQEKYPKIFTTRFKKKELDKLLSSFGKVKGW